MEYDAGSQYDRTPAEQQAYAQDCMHKYITAPDGTASCQKCGAVLRSSNFEAYNAYLPQQAGTASSAGMSPRRRWLIVAGVVALAFVGILAWRYSYRHGPPVASAGKGEVIDLANEPIQTDIARRVLLVNRPDGLTIIPRANYKISGKVLCVRHYAGFDNASTGFPIDLGLAWGDVGKADYSRDVKFYFSNDEKANQWLMFHYKDALPWSEGYFNSHVSNNHICAATQNLYNALISLKKDDLVSLEGFLAESRTADGTSMDTSLSRNDTGAGACESFYVTKLQVGDVVYK
jgi:hypothetical protein